MMRTILLILYNFLRFKVAKILCGKYWSINAIQRISPAAHIKRYGKGKIILGYNLDIAPSCTIVAYDGVVNIGDGTYFNRQCMISSHDSVTVGSGCMFGPGVKIFDNNHRFSKDAGVSSNLSYAPIIIGNNCWIASDVIILKGAQIGDNCVIGAGCIINEKIPAGSIVRQKMELDIEPIR